MTVGTQRLNECLECGDLSPLSMDKHCLTARTPTLGRKAASAAEGDSPIFVDHGFAAVPAKIGTVPDGFTLVEMLLTLAIIAVVSAIAWPVLQKPIANRRLHSAADEVRTRWCKARIEAMRSGHVYAFRYQIGGDRFRTELDVASSSLAGIQTELSDASEDEFYMAGEDSIESADMMLPEGVTFLADLCGDEGMPASLAAAETGPTAESGDWSDPILFYPDGTASDGRVVLSNDQSGAVRLSLRGITGTVTVADVDLSLE